MSTEIYGYRFTQPMTLMTLQVFASELRTAITAECNNVVARHFANAFAELYDGSIMGVVKPNAACGDDLSLKDGYLASIESRFAQGEYYGEFGCKLIALPVDENQAYALLYADRQEYIKIFEGFDCIEEYACYRDSDHPDNITDDEWEQHRLDWNTALRGHNAPAERGISINCVAVNSTFADIIYGRTNLLKYMPSFKWRCFEQASQLARMWNTRHCRPAGDVYKLIRLYDQTPDMRVIERYIKPVVHHLPKKFTKVDLALPYYAWPKRRGYDTHRAGRPSAKTFVNI